VLGADFGGLNGGVCFDASLINAIAVNRRGHRFCIHYRTFFGGGIAHELDRLSSPCSEHKRGKRAVNDSILQIDFLRFKQAIANGIIGRRFRHRDLARTLNDSYPGIDLLGRVRSNFEETR
jgi:hypothetical protein